MSEFDDFDLGGRLRAAAGGDPDLAAAHDSVKHRVVRARRRRMAAVSGAATAVIVSIGLIAALGNESGTGRLETSNSGTDTASETVPVATDQSSSTTGDSSTTSDPRGPATTIPSTTPRPTAPAVTAPPVVPTATTLPGQLPVEPTTTTSEATPNSSSTDPTTVPAPADVTQQFGSSGGSIVVRLSGGQLTLVSTSANPGYETEPHTEKPDDIEVRFESADAESRIRVRLVDGQMVPTIDEQ